MNNEQLPHNQFSKLGDIMSALLQVHGQKSLGPVPRIIPLQSP